MKRQHFAALIGLLVALFAARYLLRARSTRLTENLAQAGVARVITPEIDPATVTWVEITAPTPKAVEPAAGEAPAPASAPASPASAPAPTSAPPAPLRYEHGPAGWTVASLQGAPADAEKLDAFVKDVVAMEGEQRASQDASMETYGLDEASATKIVLGTAPGKAAATLLVGKAGDAPSANFVRAEGGPVQHVVKGVRTQLGLYGAGSAPTKDLWLEKRLLDAEAKDVAKLTVDRGDASFVVARSAAPVAASAPEGQPPPAAPPAESWTVTAPVTLPWSALASGLEGVVSRAGQVRAGDLLADPAPCAAAKTAEVTLDMSAGGTRRLVVHGKVDGRDDLAVSVDDAPQCWSLPTWGAASALPKASALYEVPAAFADVTASDPSSVRIEAPGLTVSATRKGDATWSLSGTKSGTGNASRLTRTASALRGLRIEDVAIAEKLSPDQLRPTATISAVYGGKTLQVKLLGERAGGLGERLARIDGGTTIPRELVVVLSKATVDSLLPKPDELTPTS
jgi:hypothetical protein